MEADDPFLSSLEKERAIIRENISKLNADLSYVDKMIVRRKSEILSDNLGIKLNKKNIDRVFFESLITDILRNSKKGKRTSELFESIRLMGHRINYNTLRTYVTKMRDKGFIYRKGNNYQWFATEANDLPNLPPKKD